MYVWKRNGAAVLILVAAAFLVPPANATSLTPRTVVELIDLAEYIVAGDVAAVSDGFDQGGVPYTEITLAVTESIKGNVGTTYTFRQFGLLAPRELPDGTTYLGVSPQGWPRFRTGESVFVFLYRAAEQTGLRTTVGLFQGKFTLEQGGYRNAVNNQSLFRRVEAEPGLLSEEEKKMLAVFEGAIDPGVFRGFVRKAVRGSWIEQRRVTRAD